MVHSLQSSQHGGRARPGDCIHPLGSSIEYGSNRAYMKTFTLCKCFKTCQGLGPKWICGVFAVNSKTSPCETIFITLSLRDLLRDLKKTHEYFRMDTNNVNTATFSSCYLVGDIVAVNHRLLNVITVSLLLRPRA